MRAVLDPNVLVAAAIARGGTCRLVVNAWLEGEFDVVVSGQLLDELREVLARPKFRARIALHEAFEFAALLERTAEVAMDPPPERGLTPDEGDDYLVGLARAAHVDYLISGDPHLTALPNADPPVLSPRAFLDRIVAERAERT